MDRGQRRRRGGQQNRHPPVASPAPTPLGAHQPTSLYYLPDGPELYVYKDRDGVLVTDDIDGSTRPLLDVISNLGRKSPLYVAQPSSTQQQLATTTQGNLQTTRTSPQPPPSPLPSPAPMPPVGDHQPTSLFHLPDGQGIYVYKDRYGVLVTDDIDGSTRPVQDVYREFISNRRARPNDPPPLDFDDYFAAEQAQPAPQQTATDMGGLTQPVTDVYREYPPTQLQFVKDRPTGASEQVQRHADTEPNVLASKDLLDSTTLKESYITNVSSLSQPTLPLKDELILTPELLQAMDQAMASANLFLTQPTDNPYHYWALEEPDMFSSNELFLVMATLGQSTIADASSARAEVVTHSPIRPISARKPAGWNHQFFIREDLWKVFHTYPKLSGPYRSLEEAEQAILLRLDELHDPKMRTNDGLSMSEIAIRNALYWPDGTRKFSLGSNPDEDHMGLLVEALLDKYNEENDLSGDCAYQVEKVVSFQEIYEGDDGWYYHLNCTTKTKAGVNNLFFAEVVKMIRGELDELEEFELTCLHMLEPTDNGTCYGCTNDVIGMKHPIDAGKYKGGHDPSWPRGYGSHLLDHPDVDMDDPLVFPKDMDAWMKAEEERITYLYGDDDVDDVAESDARRTPPCWEESREKSGKYVVPARRQLV